jgi:ABC-type amino acid transport substrate-binding protein
MGNLGLLDSLVSQRTDGSLIVGRGVPSSWVGSGRQIAVSNFPTTNGHRIGVTITTRGDAVTLKLTGKLPGPVTFELPAFVSNIASASAGRVDNAAGAVTIPAHTRSVTVTLAHAPPAS